MNDAYPVSFISHLQRIIAVEAIKYGAQMVEKFPLPAVQMAQFEACHNWHFSGCHTRLACFMGNLW